MVRNQSSVLRWALVALLVLTCCSQSARGAELIAISAPDIYPDNATAFAGALTVDLVNNAKDATIYYTTDGSLPSPTSEIYTGPFRKFMPGTFIVKAIAVPVTQNRGVSVVSERTYTIVPSSVLPPIAIPGSGQYRGSVNISLTPFGGLSSAATLEYVTNVRTPTSQWLAYSSPILLTEMGLNILHARTVFPQNKTVSPYATFLYKITPPLVFDVTTECTGCDGIPTAGELFTVWIQEPTPGSLVFLSITASGCEKHAHRLDDTDEVVLGAHRTALHFRTLDPEGRKVYVCIQEDTEGAWQRVKRRDGSDHFVLRQAIRSIPKAAPATTTIATIAAPAGAPASEKSSGRASVVTTWAPLRKSDNNPFAGSSSGGTSSRTLLLVCAIGVIILAIVFKRRSTQNHRARTRRREVSVEDSETIDERDELRS